MNKTDIIDAVCAKLGADATKADATELVDATFEEMEHGLVRNGKLMITGFGFFRVADNKCPQGPQSEDGRTDSDRGEASGHVPREQRAEGKDESPGCGSVAGTRFAEIRQNSRGAIGNCLEFLGRKLNPNRSRSRV